MSQQSTTQDLCVEAGTTFVFDFFVYESDGITPMDLTGWNVRMQVRADYSKKGTAICFRRSINHKANFNWHSYKNRTDWKHTCTKHNVG